MDADKLVTMANQIAAFFTVQGAGAEAAIADHIARNWDPRMRAAIAAHLAQGGAGLAPAAKAAVERLATRG
jgi:formate dehydrogenase subunit delta